MNLISIRLNRSLLVCFTILNFLFLGQFSTIAQTSSQNGNGNWDTGANWSGGSAPSSGGWTTINTSHTLSRASGWAIAGTLNVNSGGKITFNGATTVGGGSTLNINSGGSLTIAGNFTHSGSAVNVNANGTLTITGTASFTQNINVYGVLRITGNTSLTGNLRVFPGGSVVTESNITVVSSQYLTIGTSVAPPPYADMIVKGNLICSSSGDIIVNRNGRLAVYGDLTSDTSGGTFMTINNGGQAFIGGDLIFPGGSDAITNNNSGGNIGLYVDGVVDVDEANGGSVGNPESQGGYASSDYLRDTEGGGSFYNWLVAAESSPLPVELISFEVKQTLNVIVLTWKTVTEKDNDFFTIEKSLDGRTFIAMGEITGGGTTTDLRFYSWNDANATSGLVYYRLSQTDFDGTTEALGLKSLNSSGFKSNFSFYPNPVSVTESLKFDGSIPERIMLYNQSGQLILDSPVLSYQLQLPATLKSGLYLMVTSVGGQRASHRLFIK